MSNVIVGGNVSDAWIKASQYLDRVGGQDYNLVVQVSNPTEENMNVRNSVNQFLKTRNFSAVETVSSTIFPKGLWNQRNSREMFYSRFKRLYPEIRKVKSNNTGTYFGRLVDWGHERPKYKTNQLEEIINKLRANKTEEKCIYEMSIYDPQLDCKKMMAFPCMSFISLKIRGSSLDMYAVYRNQYFVKKAYGNYLGLGRLLEFIASQAELDLGILTCLATHAELEGGNKTPLKKLFMAYDTHGE